MMVVCLNYPNLANFSIAIAIVTLSLLGSLSFATTIQLIFQNTGRPLKLNVH